MKGKVHVICSVHYCYTSSFRHPHRLYFKLPKDPTMRALWLQKLNRTENVDNSRVYVCHKHFPNEMMYFSGQRTLLRRNAVPILCMGRASEGRLLDQEDATTSSAATGGTPPNKQRPIAKRMKFVEHIKDEDIEDGQGELLDDLQAYLPEDLLKELEESEIINQKTQVVAETQLITKDEPKTLKCIHKFEIFALKLYFEYPNAYKLLRNTFSLPTISTLFRSCLPTSTALSEGVMTALSTKVGLMTNEQTDCVICVRTMSLAPDVYYDAESDNILGFHEIDGVQTLEPARSVLIIMVRGLFYNWQQIVSFSFLSNFHNTSDVIHFIDKIISRLFSLGLNIRAYLTDPDTDKLTGGMNRDVSIKSPFIFATRKIFFMYDPLYLMNKIRENMLTYDINYNSGVIAKWKFLEECYDFDSQRPDLFRLAPKLTENHIKPTNRELDELKLTADVFSTETAMAMSAYLYMKSKQFNTRSSQGSAQWFSTMSKFLALLNFSTRHPSSDKSTRFSGETNQVEFLVGLLSTSLKMRLVPMVSDNTTGESSEPPIKKTCRVVPSFSEAFRVTTNAVLLLYGQLKTEKRWLPIVGLSLDCIDDFFHNVHQKYDFVKPSSKQITECITELPACNIFRYSCSRKRNPNELEMFMTEANRISINIEERHESGTVEFHLDPCHEEIAEFRTLQLSEEEGVEHLSLYLLYKAYQRHNDCAYMQAYCCSDYAAADDDDSHVRYKTEDGQVVNEMPPNFLEFIDILEIKFKDYFRDNQLTCCISGLKRFIELVEFEMPCACFPLDYVKLLYLRLRLYLVLKYNNEVFRRSADCKTTFVVNDL